MIVNPVDLRLARSDVEALIDAVMDQEIRWKTRLRLAQESYARNMTPLRRHEVEMAEKRLCQFNDIYTKLLNAVVGETVDKAS